MIRLSGGWHLWRIGLKLRLGIRVDSAGITMNP